MKRRLGQFYLSSLIVDNGEILKAIFKHLGFAPLHVNRLGYMDKYHYIGISDQFEMIDEDRLATEYTILIDFNDNNDEFDISVDKNREETEMANTIDEMTELEAKSLLNDIADVFSIGCKATTASVIMTNVKNSSAHTFCKMREKDLGDTLENGLQILCESMGVDTERYDTDDADTECYMECFKEAAAALRKFGVVSLMTTPVSSSE